VIAGVALLAVFPIARTRAFPHPKRFALPALAAVVAVVFLFFASPLRLNLPLVVTPSYRSSWDVSRQAATMSPRTLAFGTGPGTFAFDFARFKPSDVNQTAFWESRFDRSKSHTMTMLATTGLVGFASMLLLGLALGLRALSRLLVERDREEWRMTYVFFVGWSLLVLVHLFYTSNLTLQFLFWAFSGLLASQVAERAVGRRFAEAPKASLAASFLFVLLCAGLFAGAGVSAKRLSADAAFARAVMLDQGGAPVETITGELVQAVRGNPLSDAYHRNLSQALLLDAAAVIRSAGGKELDEEQTKRLSALVSESVNQARVATGLAPNDVANWVALGAVYRDLMSFVGNAEDFAAASFERAAVLEPANPSHYANLGRVHLLVAERAAQIKASKDVKDAELKKQAADAELQQLRAAEGAFAAAVQLKPDYAPGHYYLAVVYERQGRLADAAARLVVLSKANPSDLNLAFQLGILQLRLEKFADAQRTFDAILKAAPDNSNVMWFYASALELGGKQADAIKLVERVKELNPENELVTQRLERMRAGEITTTIPKPVEEGAEVQPTDVETPPTADASAAEPVTDMVDGAAATP
jgi:tetratricopeptide (TPR) repeat protein